MTAALALLAISFPGPFAEEASLSVAPAAWGSSPSTAAGAPAGISRMEGPELMASWAEGEWAAASGMPVGPVFASLGAGTSGGDSVSVDAAVAIVVTGDPVGFMEGYFGPSISVGAGGRARLLPGGDELTASAGIQFSVFPTLAVGVTVSSIPVSTPRGSGVDAGTEWGASYIFSREFRVHMSSSPDGAAIGAELRPAEMLRIRTGTSGEDWRAGATLLAGRFSLDYGAAVADSSVSHTVSVRVVIGGGDWY